jgi:hypothetical protein
MNVNNGRQLNDATMTMQKELINNIRDVSRNDNVPVSTGMLVLISYRPVTQLFCV